jgi:ascorbate-specific PTS system EIIC-type component UlaA
VKSTGETTNTTEKEQKLPVTEKNGTAPEKTEHILNRLIIGAGVCVAVIAVLIGVKLYRQDRQNAFDAVAGKRDGACFFP